MKKTTKTTALTAAAFAVLGLAAPMDSRANIVELTDGNASAKFRTLNDASVDTDLQDGMYRLTVNGVDQVGQRWFWYRLGNGAEQRLNTLSQGAAPVLADVDGDGNNDYLKLEYLGAGFKVAVTYILTGGTGVSTTADIAETIKVINTSASAISFSLFHYTDYDLNNDASDDSVEVVGVGNTFRTTQSSSQVINETVFAPRPTAFQAGDASTLLGSLDDGLPTVLTNTSVFNSPDAAWVAQWSTTLGAGRSLVVGGDSLTAVAVPEPTSTAVVLGAMGVLLGARRRRGATR